MKRLPELVGFHEAVDLDLEERRLKAATGIERQKVDIRQRINYHAYFLLCWGQLEVEIDSACRDAIRARRDDPDWKKRRGWDLYNPDDRRLSGLTFEERLGLVLDRKSAGEELQKAMKWYSLRNFIAHGGSHEERIDLAEVTKEFYLIQGAVSR